MSPDITVHASLLVHNVPHACLVLYRCTLGFGVRNDVAGGGMRRLAGK